MTLATISGRNTRAESSAEGLDLDLEALDQLGQMSYPALDTPDILTAAMGEASRNSQWTLEKWCANGEC